MKNKFRDMETLLRRKLGNYQLPVEEQDWADFLSYAQKKKKKKGWLWMSLVFFALLSLSTFAYMTHQNFFNSGSENDAEIESSSYQVADQNDSEPASSNQSTSLNQNSQQTQVEKAESQNDALSLNTTSNNKEDNQAPHTTKNTPEIDKDPFQKQKDAPNDIVIPNEAKPDNSITGSDGISKNDPSASESVANNQDKLESVWLFKNASNWKLENKSPELLQPKSPQSNQKTKVRPPSLLSIYASVSRTQGSSSWDVVRSRDSNDIIHRQYADALSKNSVSIKGVGFEVGIRYPIFKSLCVSTGIEYNSRTQSSKFSFIRSEFPVIDQDDKISAYIPDTFGTEIMVNIEDKVSSFRVPVLVSYQFNVYKHLSLGIRAGVQLGYQSVLSQKSLDPVYLVDIANGQSTGRGSFSYSGGLFAEYRLKRWGLNLSVDQRYFNPIYKSSQSINSTPKLYDFRFTLIRFL